MTGDSSTEGLTEHCRELARFDEAQRGVLGERVQRHEAYAKFMEEFAERAPEEIRKDFGVLGDAFGKIAEALEGVDLSPGATPDPEAVARLQEVIRTLDQAKLTKAGTNITAWVQENCTPER
jgi:hypothetical protein